MIQDSKARLHKKTGVPTKLGSLSTRQLHSVFVKHMIPLHHIRYICLYWYITYIADLQYPPYVDVGQ